MTDFGALCLGFLAFIAQHGHYPAVADCPGIEVVSVPELMSTACEGRPCPAQAFYDRQDNVILLSEEVELDFALGRSILLHELVHYVQDRSGRWEEDPDLCRAGMLRELHAFRLQERYLLEQNIRIPVSQNMIYYRC
jgi:hypothetical protein